MESVARFPWDWESGSIDRIILNHVIEHLSKLLHNQLFVEVNRVLKVGGELYLGYPEFTRCAQAYIDDKKHNREFWEQTIFGRQNHSGDFHVCSITDSYIRGKLIDYGMTHITMKNNERTEEYTDCIAVKTRNIMTNEEAMGLQWA